MKLICYLSLAIVIGVLLKSFAKGAKQKGNNERYPAGSLGDALATAVLLLNETNIHTSVPVPLHGRVDQVFKLANGNLLILDTKVRDREKVYLSDRVQLTVYAIILTHMGYSVSSEGIIRIVGRHSTAYKVIPLLPERSIVELYHRYIGIIQRKTIPRCTCGKHRLRTYQR